MSDDEQDSKKDNICELRYEFDKINKIIDNEANDLQEKCHVRSNRNRREAQFWNRLGLGLGFSAVVIGVVPGFLSGIRSIDPIYSSLTSMIVGLIAAVITFIRPGARYESFKNTSDQWADLEDKVDKLRDFELNATKPDANALVHEFEDILKKKSKITQNSMTLSNRMDWLVPAKNDIALFVKPMIVHPHQRITVKGVLTSEIPRKKIIKLELKAKSTDGDSSIPFVCLTKRHGRFRITNVRAPMVAGDYYINASNTELKAKSSDVKIIVRE
jgi:hypothetical protein